MMKNYLLLMMLFALSTLQAQNGNTLSDAIIVDGINAEVSIAAFDTATNSMQQPMCVSNADVFYKHTVSTGENKVVIGMASVGVLIALQLDYQILMAPGGDTSNLQMITCDSYTIPILAGGGFEEVISDVNPGDVYYLRTYEPSGAGSFLSGLLSSTVITMVSEFDSTLSVSQVGDDNFDYLVNDNQIKLLNNEKQLNYSIYNLTGQSVLQSTNNQIVNNIDISSISQGIYVLSIQSGGINETFKFIKN